MPDLAKITGYLDSLEQGSHIFSGQVKRVDIDRLGSEDDWDENQFTYDSKNDLKRSLNLLIMDKISFLKLQKLLADLYIYGNQKITNLSTIQLLFPDYLKLSVSILKKIFHNHIFDP